MNLNSIQKLFLALMVLICSVLAESVEIPYWRDYKVNSFTSFTAIDKKLSNIFLLQGLKGRQVRQQGGTTLPDLLN